MSASAHQPRSLEAEIFSVGIWNGETFAVEDLQEIARNFALLREVLVPPLKLGHDGAQTLLGQTDGDPVLGWVDELRVVGEKLIARLEGLPKVLHEAIREGRYRSVSAELYFAVQHQGRSLGKVLKAVALLGADLPAVTNLADLAAFLDLPAAAVEHTAALEAALGAGPEQVRLFTLAVEEGAILLPSPGPSIPSGPPVATGTPNRTAPKRTTAGAAQARSVQSGTALGGAAQSRAVQSGTSSGAVQSVSESAVSESAVSESTVSEPAVSASGESPSGESPSGESLPEEDALQRELLELRTYKAQQQAQAREAAARLRVAEFQRACAAARELAEEAVAAGTLPPHLHERLLSELESQGHQVPGHQAGHQVPGHRFSAATPLRVTLDWVCAFLASAADRLPPGELAQSGPEELGFSASAAGGAETAALGDAAAASLAAALGSRPSEAGSLEAGALGTRLLGPRSLGSGSLGSGSLGSGPLGSGPLGSGPLGASRDPSQELARRASAKMLELKVSYGRAADYVLQTQPGLARAYRDYIVNANLGD